ncbi:helicase-associated domain-containing protein [Luethyella okanaganae]|uniref:Helicase-associated domain-containing protein n=1 Tax=Luethyella okanaganae TaxID=69372 RepID=A0ABW1VGZ5_9MICO
MLSLAARLRSLGDTELAAALESREFASTGIHDYFDLAEALLAPESIQHALANLDRTRLAVLAVAGELAAKGEDEPGRTDATSPALLTKHAPTAEAIATRLSELGQESVTAEIVLARSARLHGLLLATLDGHTLMPFAAVSERLCAWPREGLPGVAELAAPHPPVAVDAPVDADTRIVDRLAAERAFASVSATAELVASVSAEPARELSRGGLSLPDSKRLALAMGVSLDDVPAHLGIAVRAELVARDSGHWLATDAGEEWLHGSTSARWAVLARAWHAELPADVRDVLAARAHRPWGSALLGYVAWIYPAAGTRMDERIAERTRDAELLGITAGGTPGAAGALLLAGRADDAENAVASLLPPEVENVYLQHDLTIVAPGPLTPALDARLRGMAEVEGRELASSYRVTAASVNRALATGETAETILEFLAGISLTGVPQPLDYLVTESAARYGRLRVSAVHGEDSMHSAVRSDDAELLGTVAVDQLLASLGLLRSGPHRLLSRFTADVVFWALSDARYPVAAEDAEGEIIRLRRRHATQSSPAAAGDPVSELIARLRMSNADTTETGQAWLARQLDIAIRAKQALTVSVRLPGGVVSDYLLEPTSVANGRLRARDRTSDIERTLPLSSIVTIAPSP